MGALADLPPHIRNHLPFDDIEEQGNKIYYTVKIGKGKLKFYYLCKPIDVPTVTHDIFTGDEMCTFKNPHGIEVQIKPSDIDSKSILRLADKGMEVNYFTSWYFMRYLHNLIYIANTQPSYARLGFYEDNGETKFLWDKIYPCGLSRPGIYTGEINISSKGTVKEWRLGIIKLVQGHYALELMLVCSFSAMLIGYIGKDKGIDTTIVDFWGTSSTGKSSGARVAASVYGDPDIAENSICSSWFSTGNSLIMSLVNLYGIVRVLDDTSSAITKDMEQMIYKVSNGKDKGRLNGDIQQIKSGTWRTLVISTGENPILEDTAKQGAHVRAIEFNLQLTESAEHAHELNEFTNKQYGTAVLYFAQALLKIGKERIVDKYDKMYEKLLKILTDKPLNERLCKVYTIILLAAILFNKIFKMNFNVKEIKKLIVEANDNRKTQEDSYEEAIDKILAELSIRQKEIIYIDEYEKYAKNGTKISYDKAFRTPHDVIGVLDMRHGFNELSINRNVIDDILLKYCNYRKGEVNNVYRYFKKKNYIKTYDKGFAMKRQIGAGGRIPAIVFNAKVLFDGRQYESKNIPPSNLTQKIRRNFGGLFE